MAEPGCWRIEKGGVSGWVEPCLKLPKERYAVTSSSTVVPLRQRDSIEDPLTSVLGPSSTENSTELAQTAL